MSTERRTKNRLRLATKGFFVTGTDTNVGKTVLSSLLCAALNACYWKPIQTGAREGTDREQVIAWSGIKPEQAFRESYIFDDPVSPHLAAEFSNEEISLSNISISQQVAGYLIVEGAGGVLVPINDHQFMTDLMRHIGLPVIVAARGSLGTINHTLLSLRALQAAQVAVRGVVMIGEAYIGNRRAIECYGHAPVIGTIPQLREINSNVLKQIFETNFDKQLLMQ